jgi:predicted aspartyl protease
MVLFDGRQADRLRVDAAVPAMRVSTLSGDGTARRVIVRELLVGPVALRDVPAARIALPEGTIQDSDGLLPLSLFARVSFHHHEGYMVVQPR